MRAAIMNIYFILRLLYKGLKIIMFMGASWFVLQFLIFCAYMYGQIRALMEIPASFLSIPANVTDSMMLGLVYKCSAQFLMHVQGASVGTVLSLSLHVLSAVVIYILWRKCHPKAENVEWQGIWKGLGKRLEAWGPPVSWDFTLEHLWDPEKLSEHLGKGWCSSGRSEEERLIWGLACAYRALYNSILERERFQNEIRTKRGNSQVEPNQLQGAPVSMLVAPVEGQKWKWVSSRLERKEEKAEEVEEDPGEGPFPKPSSLRKATEKSRRHGEESDEEEVTVTTIHRPLKITEIQGTRREFTRHVNEPVMSWLLRCWDSGAGSVSLSSDEARQLGNIARDSAIDRGISRCLDGVATLWERMLLAVKERYPFKDDLKPEWKPWNTAEKGIQYLKETALVEMLCDPRFVPNDPGQDRDPEKTRSTPDSWWKLTKTAPARKALNHELSKLFNEMWDLDVNRFAPGKDYAIELQGKADAVQRGDSAVQDSAPRHLFHYVNEERLKNTKTFATFISLLDNYETSTGVEEVVTPEEIAENNCFLDAILMTGVMKLAHEYLLKKKLAKPNLADFKYQLYDIWFQLYPRKEGDRPDSCGFEHVFVGETRHGKQILGLHNWVQFYLQEKHKQIDYKGYITRKNKIRPDRDDQVVSIQFSWKGSVKPIGSTFVGVSPEFEFALYTVIFLLSEERVTRETVKIEEYELQIVVCRHGRHIGTAYPVLLNTNNEDQ